MSVAVSLVPWVFAVAGGVNSDGASFGHSVRECGNGELVAGVPALHTPSLRFHVHVCLSVVHPRCTLWGFGHSARPRVRQVFVCQLCGAPSTVCLSARLAASEPPAA